MDELTEKNNRFGKNQVDGKKTWVQVGTNVETIMVYWKDDGVETTEDIALELPLKGRNPEIDRREWKTGDKQGTCVIRCGKIHFWNLVTGW